MNRAIIIAPEHPAVGFDGCAGREHSGGAVRFSRIPPEDRELFPGALCEKARMAAGVRMFFSTDSAFLALRVNTTVLADGSPGPEQPLFDLCIDGKIFATATEHGGFVEFDGLPHGDHAIEVLFPLNAEVVLFDIRLETGASLEPSAPAGRRIVLYGSSITHCIRAKSPAFAWPEMLRRSMNADMTMLGFAGECKLDSMVFRLIRDMDADLILLETGINLYEGDMSERTYSAALTGGIALIREKHVRTPLILLSPIYGTYRDEAPGKSGMTLNDMRALVSHTATLFRKRRDHAIFEINGTDIFGPEDAHLLCDGLHPGPEGIELTGMRLIRLFKEMKFL